MNGQPHLINDNVDRSIYQPSEFLIDYPRRE